MTQRSSPAVRFLGELRRRRVFRVTALYIVLAIGSIEFLDVLIPATQIPEWATPLLIGVAVVGLPIVVVLAWTFDLTPKGVVKTDEAEDPEAGPTSAESRDGDSAAEPFPDITAVAVLPFENLSGSAEAEPFALGLHDDLLTELSRASALTVISRTSVQGYRGTDKGVRQIARELGVGTIVEGAVQQAGSRVRLNVQVIDARTDAHRWAERYDRELTPESIFELQSELVAHIMAAVEAELTSKERARVHAAPTDDLEAYRLYSLGREAHVDRSEEGLRTAASYFERALERDPHYAAAWAGLGMVLVALVDYGHVADDETLRRGIAALERAVELDPELAEAHAGLGALRTYQRDGKGAREALARAVEKGPGLALGYQWTSWVELLLGNPAAASRAGRRATRLAPLDPEARGNLAMALLAERNAAAAADEARRSLESHPDFAYSRWVLALALDELGREDEALAELERLDEQALSPWPTFVPWATLGRGVRQARAGDAIGARKAAAELGTGRAPFEAGLLWEILGDRDAAFEALGRAAPFFWDDALALRYARAFGLAALRDDTRYDELIAGLDRSWAG